MESLSPWPAMETDCLVEIFKKLGLEDLTLSVPFVCKSWRAAFLQPLCWRKLDFRQLDVLPWSNFSKRFASQYSLPYFTFTTLLNLAIKRSFNSVTELVLPLKSTSPVDLKLISDQCPNLKSIALPILCSEDETLISKIVPKWKDLERLELKFCPMNFPDLLKSISLYCKSFSELISAGEIRREDAMAIVDYVPRMKKLDLSGSYLPKKELLIIVEGCKELQELRVNGCIGFDGDDDEIKATVNRIRKFEGEHCKLCSDYAYNDCDDWSVEFGQNGYVF